MEVMTAASYNESTHHKTDTTRTNGVSSVSPDSYSNAATPKDSM